MKNLIKISENAKGTWVVDARELWEGLESGRQFADWVKSKLIKNPYFEENVDYILLPKSMKQVGHGGHNRIDYALTIDTAKKVAMSERTKKGDQVRNYFLECEKSLQEVRSGHPSNYISALRELIASEEAKEALLIENNEMKPKA